MKHPTAVYTLWVRRIFDVVLCTVGLTTVTGKLLATDMGGAGTLMKFQSLTGRLAPPDTLCLFVVVSVVSWSVVFPHFLHLFYVSIFTAPWYGKSRMRRRWRRVAGGGGTKRRITRTRLGVCR